VFESVDANDGSVGQARWEAAGRPTLPSVAIDGIVSPLLHVSQLSSLLGLRGEPDGDAVRLAWDTVSLLEAWIRELAELSWQVVTRPTPSRGRSLRNLTVNVFHPFELLPGAWLGGEFPWHPELDDDREAAFADTAGLVGWACEALDGWRVFLAGYGDEIGERDPPVASPRGRIGWTALLASQRWHAAFHLRQLELFLAIEGLPRAGTFTIETLAGLELPAEVW
jgi:hypothetical protein